MYFSCICRKEESCSWFFGLHGTHIVHQVANPPLGSIVCWTVCGRTLTLVWREARSNISCCNLVCLTSWRWWRIANPSSSQRLQSFPKCLLWWCKVTRQASYLLSDWLHPEVIQSARRPSVTEHRDNLTYFIQVWSFAHPELGRPLFKCYQSHVLLLTVHWAV